MIVITVQNTNYSYKNTDNSLCYRFLYIELTLSLAYHGVIIKEGGVAIATNN